MLNTYCKCVKDVVLFATPQNIKDADFALDENFMVKLTKDNAEKAFACIRANKRYKNPAYADYYQETNKHLSEYTKREFIEIVRLIARANSTRTPQKNAEILGGYIYDNRKVFLERLKKGDKDLIPELANYKGLSRKESSLASKICVFLCELEFQKSNFIVNDNVVRTVLPYYLHYYDIDTKSWQDKNGLKDLNKCSYAELFDLVKAVKEKSENTLTFREIDHILWYCYKNDPVRTAVAIELAKKA